MARREKVLERARNSPRGWRFEELRSLLERFGFVIYSRSGSHFYAVHPDSDVKPGLVKHSRELPPGYVRNAVRAIDEVKAKQRGRK
ncbi:MAG: type II toxin-antitoxin system HicA family toxin [Anaerolineae bacterium]|nr:type II toxin-antitoxin system HicA family toxin [Anaerolineae bacterium]